MNILFGNSETQDDNMFCAGGIGDRTPSDGSDDDNPLLSDDNVGCSSVGHASRRSRKEQVVDSPPPKRNKRVEYYVERISESMLERSRNETSLKSRDQDEVTELLRVVESDGVGQGSELYFIATELFRSATRRASFRSIRDPQNRIAWLKWTWENAKK